MTIYNNFSYHVPIIQCILKWKLCHLQGLMICISVNHLCINCNWYWCKMLLFRKLLLHQIQKHHRTNQTSNIYLAQYCNLCSYKQLHTLICVELIHNEIKYETQSDVISAKCILTELWRNSSINTFITVIICTSDVKTA